MLLLMLSSLIPSGIVLADDTGVRAAAPAVPIQESPANGATDLPTWVAVRWTLSNPGEVYRLQVATDPAMTALVVDANVSNATGYSLYAVAQKNTTYYWRLNATKDGSTSDWSPVWSFTTTNKFACRANVGFAGKRRGYLPREPGSQLGLECGRGSRGIRLSTCE